LYKSRLHPSYGTSMFQLSSPPARKRTTTALYGFPFDTVSTGGGRSPANTFSVVVANSGVIVMSSCAVVSAACGPPAWLYAWTTNSLVDGCSRPAVRSKSSSSITSSGSVPAGCQVKVPSEVVAGSAQLRVICLSLPNPSSHEVSP